MIVIYVVITATVIIAVMAYGYAGAKMCIGQEIGEAFSWKIDSSRETEFSFFKCALRAPAKKMWSAICRYASK